MRQRLEARKMLVEKTSVACKVTEQDVKTKKDSLSAEMRSLLVDGTTLSIAKSKLQIKRARRVKRRRIWVRFGEGMSLVDYDDSSSSDDDVIPAAAEHKEALPQSQPQQKLKPYPTSITRRSLKEKKESEELPQLPDALLLLESPRLTHVSGNDHASVVAAAMAESALRKREFNGKSSSLPRRSKLPRGNLPHSKNSPDTLGNVLVPPQLKGRSNVATEDMSRLFVKKQHESSKARSPNQE